MELGAINSLLGLMEIIEAFKFVTKRDINSIKNLTYQSLFRSKNNKVGNTIQAPSCIRILFCCNSPPLATLESIIRRPKNAEPLKAIHNILLNPLKETGTLSIISFLIQDQFLTFIN